MNIVISDTDYTVLMHVLREARLRPPVVACPVAQSFQETETNLRRGMMRGIAAELKQADGEPA